MPAIPVYAKLHKFPFEPESAVLRTEMESGPPKQAKLRSRVMVERPVTYSLDSKADYLAFMTWVRGTINRGVSWFDWTDPLDNVTKLARIKGGKVSYKSLNAALSFWEASFVLETWDG